MKHLVNRVEIPVKAPDRAGRFYSSLLGVDLSRMPAHAARMALSSVTTSSCSSDSGIVPSDNSQPARARGTGYRTHDRLGDEVLTSAYASTTPQSSSSRPLRSRTSSSTRAPTRSSGSSSSALAAAIRPSSSSPRRRLR